MQAVSLSRASRFQRLPLEKRKQIIDGLSIEDANRLRYSWDFWARPEQKAPEGNWLYWLLLSGRGFGKTRAGSEWVRERVEAGAQRIALIGKTTHDVRQVMIQSGILAVYPPDERPEWQPSLRQVTFKNGARAWSFSAEEPDQIRGFELDTVWLDEFASYDKVEELWHECLIPAIRRGTPKVCITTTPKPKPLLRELMKHKKCVITRGSTFDNADNLSSEMLEELEETYSGTSIGRQELYGELLDEMPGALWTRSQIDANRIKVADAPEHYTKVVVGVDPAISSGGTTGIVVVGADNRGHGYVLADCSVRGLPGVWARRVVNTYKEWKADVVVCEINQGGDMCVANIATVDPHVPVKVTHASRGKRLRAEPIAAKSEQSKFHHVGSFAQLEDQMCCWTPEDKESPDRLDACVHAANSAILGGQVHAISFGDVGKRTSPNRI
jgi:phage terminase large subunit-like protein